MFGLTTNGNALKLEDFAISQPTQLKFSANFISYIVKGVHWSNLLKKASVSLQAFRNWSLGMPSLERNNTSENLCSRLEKNVLLCCLCL